jgi:hypothetical protein
MFADLLHWIHSYRKRRGHRQLFEDDRQAFYEKIFHGNVEPRILTVPFRNMLYLNAPDFGPIAPKWLGSYKQRFRIWSASCASADTKLLPILARPKDTKRSDLLEPVPRLGYSPLTSIRLPGEH